MGRYKTVEELSETIVDPEHQLSLKDIASVSYEPPQKDWSNRINGQEAMGFEIVRSAEANVVHISHAVEAALEELASHPKLRDLESVVFWDQGKHVTSSVYNLRDSGLWGGLFAAVVLFFFLRAVRMTLIITLAIPLCIMVTITALYFAGWSLNMATMMGLMLSLGLVVDNAIVIVENIFRLRQSGVDPRRASIEGAGEVGLPVTMATLTTVVVFLPLVLMGSDDNMAFWMLRIGVPVMVGLVASLFIALLIIPLAALKMGSDKERSDSAGIAWLQQRYERSLRWVLTHRLDAFILVVPAVASMRIPMEGISRTDRNERDETRIMLNFEMPSGQSLEQAETFMSAVEDTLIANQALYNVANINSNFSAGRGEISMYLQEEEDLEWYSVAWSDLLKKLGIRNQPYLDYDEVEEDLQMRLQMPPGVKMRVNWQDTQEDAAVSVTLSWGNAEKIRACLWEWLEKWSDAWRVFPGYFQSTPIWTAVVRNCSSGSIAARCSASESAPKRFRAVFPMPCAVIRLTSSTLKTGGKLIFRCSWKRIRSQEFTGSTQHHFFSGRRQRSAAGVAGRDLRGANARWHPPR